jgi:hypothetical protein
MNLDMSNIWISRIYVAIRSNAIRRGLALLRARGHGGKGDEQDHRHMMQFV